ncbi:Caspase-9-like protein [Leptotrombidium deliense]|uniref:Caspase-9-like protein n=1 Tax=Leptotrombidium deliense TaxID=299467 RepID=A0A443RXV4_9ACAR|nr:Caspase-9-like protein [Leptotrombidium deliense]
MRDNDENINSIFDIKYETDYIVKTSDMLVIWSTIRNYSNLIALMHGSELSRIIRTCLKKGHSGAVNLTREMDFYINIFIHSLEINKINLKKAVVFGHSTDDIYDLTNGLCLIFTNTIFSAPLKHKYISEVTVNNYYIEFKRHGFDCIKFEDFTANEMITKLQAVVSGGNLKSHNAFVIIIISSFETINGIDEIYGKDGNFLPLNKIKMLLSDERCEDLVGKLKLLILDGPRGCINLFILYMLNCI